MKFTTTIIVIILCTAVCALEKVDPLVDASDGNVHTLSLDSTDEFCEGDSERCKVNHCLNISSFDLHMLYMFTKKRKKLRFYFLDQLLFQSVAIYSLLLSPLPTDTWLIFEPSPTSPFTRSIRKWRFAAKFPLSFVRP